MGSASNIDTTEEENGGNNIRTWTYSGTLNTELIDDVEEEDQSIPSQSVGEAETQNIVDTTHCGDDTYDDEDVIQISSDDENENEGDSSVEKTVSCTARCKNGCLRCKCRKAGERCDQTCSCAGCKNRADSPHVANAKEQWETGNEPLSAPSPPSHGPKVTPSSILDSFAILFPDSLWEHFVQDTQLYYDSQPDEKQQPKDWKCSTLFFPNFKFICRPLWHFNVFLFFFKSIYITFVFILFEHFSEFLPLDCFLGPRRNTIQ